MDYLPLFFELTQRPVWIVGGGGVALRKLRLLIKAQAKVTVIAPAVDAEVKQLLASNQGSCVQQTWQRWSMQADIELPLLIISATPDIKANEAVAQWAGERSIPVNVVDNPELCSFIFPALIDRSPLLVAVGSGGRSPVLVRRTRSLIEAALPHAYGRLASFAGNWRELVKQALPDLEARRLFWESTLDGPIAELVLSGQEQRANEELEQSLAEAPVESSGEVFLIGAGPGDPDLMTFRAARLLQAADVVVYDRLVTNPILEMARRDAERIYVGKRRDLHTLPQQEINQLLLELAQKGLRVARLKGGDPFIFGRGGEEIELLAAHQIPFQVVPGITAASGCASYAGIPLTHRDHAQSVRFLTAHLRDGSVELPWQDLTSSSETLVFYMGLQGLAAICANLRRCGRDENTPVALIEQGTTRHQRTFVGTLATMQEQVADKTIHAPTLIIVGGVVSLRESLSWYGETSKPGRWPPA